MRFKIAIPAFLGVLTCTHMALAEIVRLKNGTVLHGSIVSMSDAELVVDTADMGQVKLKRRAVQSFEDDSGVTAPTLPPAAQPAPPAIVAATPLAAAGPLVVNNNNNNSNSNTTSAATVASAPVAPAPTPAAPLAPVAEIHAAPAVAAPGEENEGLVFGAIRGGVAYSRYYGSTWSQPVPTIHWDVVGYRWDNGLNLTAFGEGSQKDAAAGRQWLEGGLQAGIDFGRRTTRFGSGAFFAGIGGGYLSVTQSPTLTQAEADEMQPDDYWGDEQTIHNTMPTTIDRSGYAFTGSLGYRFMGRSGLGVDIGLSASHGYLGSSKQMGSVNCYEGPRARDVCDELSSHPNFQTLGVTAGLAYAL